MSFSPDWLALREPADHAARNPDVLAALARHFAETDEIAVVDLGCGTGSNLRGLFSTLSQRQTWTLIDHDSVLLNAARETLSVWADNARPDGEGLILSKDGKVLTVRFRQADLARGDTALLFDGADLVTASALFDLVSPARIHELAETVVSAGSAFCTVLTYDGFALWFPEHPADKDMRLAFNHHQRGDKGFGPAAGPTAPAVLAESFYLRGYRVLRGTSPWLLDDRFAALRQALDQGWAEAVAETGEVSPAIVQDWLTKRRAAKDSITIVGHEDLLALPQ